MAKVKVVTICGSSKFVDIMAAVQWILERDEGAITMGLHLLPYWYCSSATHFAEFENVGEQMDFLHMEKIRLADEILVVNTSVLVDTEYIGESTRKEIEYAKSLGKKIRYLSGEPKIKEEVLWKIKSFIVNQKSIKEQKPPTELVQED